MAQAGGQPYFILPLKCFQNIWSSVAFVHQTYQLKNRVAAFCLGLGIGCGVFEGTDGSKEPMDKAIEEKEEEVTACHHHQAVEQEVHYQLLQLVQSCIFSSHQKT